MQMHIVIMKRRLMRLNEPLAKKVENNELKTKLHSRDSSPDTRRDRKRSGWGKLFALEVESRALPGRRRNLEE